MCCVDFFAFELARGRVCFGSEPRAAARAPVFLWARARFAELGTAIACTALAAFGRAFARGAPVRTRTG